MKYSVRTYTYKFLGNFEGFRLFTRTTVRGTNKYFLVPNSLSAGRAEEFEISKSVSRYILSIIVDNY